MSDTPAIRLKRGEGRAFKAGGPWIYDNEIAEILGEPADGGIVRIEDYNGYSLGVPHKYTDRLLRIGLQHIRKQIRHT